MSAKQQWHHSGVYSSSSVCTEQLHCCNGCCTWTRHYSDNGLRLDLVENPVATQIRENSRRVDLSVNGSTISIDVSEVYSVCTHIISHFIIGTAYH